MKIRTPTKREEKRFLAAMLAHMNEPPDNRLFVRFRREVFGIVAGIIFLVIALAALRTGLALAWLTTGCAFVLGLAIGSGIWRILAQKQWPVVSRCLDRAKIEARLREIDA